MVSVIRKWLTNAARPKPTKSPSPPASTRLEKQVLLDIKRSIGGDTKVAEETNTPQQPPKRENQFLVDTVKDTFTVVLHLDKGPATCLGTLEMAKDALKNVYLQKQMKKASEKGIIVPGANGKGALHAI